MKNHIRAAGIAVVLAAVGTTAMPARAQQLAIEDIVVTARKREETSLTTPVILSAVGAAELQRRAINNFDTLSRSIPQLLITNAAGGVQGGDIGIRGISAGDQNPFIDQAVTFNIDGAQVSRAGVRRMGQMDVEQVEVLKGPQALFFGKNSPGGVISVRSADPTSHFEARASVGYEINAREWRGDGYVSAPLTNDLGIRVAAYGSTMRGWVQNIAPQNPPYGPQKLWGPGTKEYAGRITLKYEPSDQFSARLKINYGHMHDNGAVGITEIYSCPLGATQNPNSGDCTLNGKMSRADGGPLSNTTSALFGNGVPYTNQNIFLTSLEMNYGLTDHLKLTSLTSYFQQALSLQDNFTWTATPALELFAFNRLPIQELGQELRLASSYDFPINFVAGGYFQHTSLKYTVRTDFNAARPSVSRYDDFGQNGQSESLFAQGIWKIIDTLELTGGGRYSWEKKELRGYRNGIEQTVPDPQMKWHNFSPEAILTWRPTSKLTVFGGYKEGFLSGGYNSGSGNFGLNSPPRHYDQEVVKGFEVGAKALLADDTVRLNFGAYTYKITGLQVSTIVNIPALNTTSQIVNNAGATRIKGFESDVTWDTPATGLALHGAVGYNHARYLSFNTTCYPGQTQALGCNLLPGAVPNTTVAATSTQVATLQSLAGQTLVRAPDWTMTMGANFERPITSDFTMGLTLDAAFSSKLFADSTNEPAGIMPAYWLFDATLRVFSTDGLEFAVIGRNLTDKLYYTRAGTVPFTGRGQGTTGPAVLGDEYGTTSRGREVILRVSKKFD